MIDDRHLNSSGSRDHMMDNVDATGVWHELSRSVVMPATSF
jgi:hypothetical protein